MNLSRQTGVGQVTRRNFLRATALTGLGAFIPLRRSLANSSTMVSGSPEGMPSAEPSTVASLSRPIVIASANGMKAVEKAMEMVQQGTDAIDAVIAGVNIVEDDPNDDSVGYGGLPNEEGVVELDAAVMHGPTYRAGAVAALRNIKNPSKVARLVMERTDHVLIVGEGALKFAKVHGFQEENLLTDKSREKWLKWKENLSKEDDWLPPHSVNDEDVGSGYEEYRRNYGSVYVGALDKHDGLSCVASTSGLAYKIPGRVGDLGILGAGIYCDNEVGAAGSTGRGEANLLNCSSVMIVEWMWKGKTPEEACLLACKRIVDRNKEKRLLDKTGKFKHNVRFYAVNKRGEYGSASIWGDPKTPSYVIHDGVNVRKLVGAYLYERK